MGLPAPIKANIANPFCTLGQNGLALGSKSRKMSTATLTMIKLATPCKMRSGYANLSEGQGAGDKEQGDFFPTPCVNTWPQQTILYRARSKVISSLPPAPCSLLHLRWHP